MTKTIDENFRDWESSAFGFGYGTGEHHVMSALKAFFGAIGNENAYDYRKIEGACGPQVAWLLINILCKDGVIDYGTSPRFGLLAPEGIELKAYIDAHSVEELEEIAAERNDASVICYRDACNCGPDGYEKGKVCDNPFWERREYSR